jgi:NAD(P)H dehydrogenase (quinone)
MIAVTGSTGRLGRLAIAALKARVPASDIVAVARDANKAADLGVEVRIADYSDKAALVEAFKGVDRLLFISGNDPRHRVEQHRDIVDAAKETGVGLIAYTSIPKADISRIGLAQEHLATEKAIKASGIPYIFLRNCWYAENYLQTIAGALASGKIVGASGDGRISAAPQADYAEAAAIAISGEGHAGNTYELGGDKSFTLAELAADIARIAGKPVSYENLSVADYAAALAGHGLSEPVAQMIAGWDVAIAAGDLEVTTGDLSRVLGRPTTPITATIEQVVAEGAKTA